jgi:transposase
MARPLVSDELWAIVEPLIPEVQRRYKYPGRKRIPDRQVLSGILFVLQRAIQSGRMATSCVASAARR